MSIQELLTGGGGLLVLALTVIQLAPIKVNPWSAIAKAIGRAVNAEVLAELERTRIRLDDHIRTDDERAADMHRARILRFNQELIRQIPHTREEFIEVLTEIDRYQRFCREHPDYPNSRAVHAIANIGRVYDERLQKHDFL
ncbi:MAG: hypothetical protein KH338_08395 [Oscillospiraceae bacterium]|nr:hypothetical protein [Oscillospiraceae bacterium]